MAKLFIFILLCFFSHSVSTTGSCPLFKQIFLPAGDFGPDSIAFSKPGEGFYCSISDGRVLKYLWSQNGFVDFAYTSPNRTKQSCDGVRDPNLAPKCGKVFGLSYDHVSGILYAVDVFYGLFAIKPQGGLSTLIANTAGGLPLKLPNGVDVNPTNGDVYFTDGSQTYDYRNLTQPNFVADSTGRLLKYDPTTKEVMVLLTNLSFPLEPAVNFDGIFVLIPELGAKRILKYWLKGPKTNTTEVFLEVPGLPRKIKRASTPGDFWMPVVAQGPNGPVPSGSPFGYKFNSFGVVLETVEFCGLYDNLISTILEINPATIYVGSRGTTFITQFIN